MLDRGLLTINEWRDRRGMDEVEWGKAPWLPLNKAQFIDGKLVIPGQEPGMPGMDAGMGMPQDGMQGGPMPTDDVGVPLPVPPDDERNPANQPQRWTHGRARSFLADAEVQEFLMQAFRCNGHKPIGAK